jgi:Putative lumazine-binding
LTDHTDLQGLNQAVQRYFDLMYDSDTSRFDRVFRSTAQLHGFRGGEMSMLSAQAYKDAIARLPSLKSRNIPREEQVLMVDFASDTQALVKVRVRWNTAVYVDYLTYHRIAGDWLITSKGFHIESTDAPGKMKA